MTTLQRSALFSVVAGGVLLLVLSSCSGGSSTLGKAETSMNEQRYEDALARVDSALAQDSANTEAYLLKARILREQADSTMAPDEYKALFQEARAAEEQALSGGASSRAKVDDQRKRAFDEQSRRGTEAFRRARKASDPDAYRQAVAHFGAASATFPDSASVILNQAYAQLNWAQSEQERSMTEAIPVLEQYIETADAPELNAYDILSALYLQSGKAQKAIDLLETARTQLAERPTHIRVEGTRGLPYSGTVEVEGASREVKGKTPDRISLDTQDGSVLGQFQKKKDAGQLRVRLFYKGGVVRDTTIQTGTARLSADLSTEAPLSEIEGRLLNAYNQAGQTEKAMAEYEEQIEKNPNNATYRYNFGSMLLQADRYDEAIEQLQKATELQPDNVKAQYNLGAAYSNKARQVQKQITAIDDSLRTISEQAMDENREPTADERDTVSALDQEKTDLQKEKKALFKKAIPPLKRARQLSDTDGSFRQDACQALVTAYVQTDRVKDARKYEDCAGLEVGQRGNK